MKCGETADPGDTGGGRQSKPVTFGFSPLKRDPAGAAFTLASVSQPTSPSWLTDGMFGEDPEGFLLSSVLGPSPLAGSPPRWDRPARDRWHHGPEPECEGGHADQLTGATHVGGEARCFCLTTGNRPNVSTQTVRRSPVINYSWGQTFSLLSLHASSAG